MLFQAAKTSRNLSGATIKRAFASSSFISVPGTASRFFRNCAPRHEPSPHCFSFHSSSRRMSEAPRHAKHTNGLREATSPYLLQHAHNPVNWVQWSQKALAQAASEDKMVFLSSGYASCHWCHVMAHESFEDESIAKVMNDNFVCIKLDREERPDVDAAYMTFIQATSGRGGWPMSVFLTSQGEPLFGGTYFPPPMFLELMNKLTSLWKNDRERCLASARDIAAQLRQVAGAGKSHSSTLPELSLLTKAVQHWLVSYDHKHGGFGNAPKFPSPPNTFHLLHRIAAEASSRSDLPSLMQNAGISEEMARHALEASVFTLARIARGGITDHLGGGIARYSVDEEWRVPHFEKMLYDQGQLLTSFSEAIQLCMALDDKDPLRQYLPEFKEALQGIVDYLERDMTSSEGALFAAEDADSLPSPSDTRAKEGAFYVWEDMEIREVLGGGHSDAYVLVAAHYGIQPEGNIPVSSDPHGDLKGTNMLHAYQSLAATAASIGIDDISVAHQLLEDAHSKLLARRSTRPRPLRDDKIITSWNGLAISGLARVSQVFGQGTPLGDKARNMASRSAEFLWNTMWDHQHGQLLRSYRNSVRGPWGFDVDYAFAIQGLLDLYEATYESKYVDQALTLQAAQDAFFWDTEGPGGYLISPPTSDGNILGRQRGDQEGAEPTSTSVTAHNLLRLQALVENLDARLVDRLPSAAPSLHDLPSVSKRVAQCITSGGMILDRAPHALGTRLTALLNLSLGMKQLLLVGPLSSSTTQSLVEIVAKHFVPRTVSVFLDPKAPGTLEESFYKFNGSVQATLSDANSAHLHKILEEHGGYGTVCVNFACGLPVVDAKTLLDELQS